MMQLGFTDENASIVTTKLFESSTKTTQESRLPNLLEVQEKNGLRAWLFDEILYRADSTAQVYVTCDSDKSSVDEANENNVLGINDTTMRTRARSSRLATHMDPHDTR